ncbi:MAG: hypothetical protein MUF81_02035 [Verrucomicrobia bacterium]|jgi:DNA polymerase-1|nr:hypothetical protein [Verrucomicrobiota bacterium]
MGLYAPDARPAESTQKGDEGRVTSDEKDAAESRHSSPVTRHTPALRRLLIVDGHAYAYRAFYAIRQLRSPAGAPTNAIFGFVKMLAKMRAGILWPSQALPIADCRLPIAGSNPQSGEGGEGRKLPPTHLIVVWDGGLSAERVRAWPGYKAQRPEMPAELREQLDDLVRYLDAAGVATFCRAGVEADDYIAGLARRAADADFEVVIASADKDFMQLVTSDECRVTSDENGVAESRHSSPVTRHSGRIGLLKPHLPDGDPGGTVWMAEQVRHKSGVEPAQIVDWLALVGDRVDNLPGVPGVGPKTAAELLNQFGTVAELYRRLDEVKSEKLRAALAASAAAVRRNVELVRLKDEMPCDFSVDALAVKPADTGRLAELFGRWGFWRMADELSQANPERFRGQPCP